jgi:phospholipid-binding lipoprotein MlaA
MKQPRKPNLKPLLAVLIAFSLCWGCAHGRGGADSPEPLTANPPQTIDGEAGVSSEPLAVEDHDPFFDDEPEADFFDEGDEPVAAMPEPLVADPLAPFNRAMFVVNDKLYFWCLKPLARGYRAVTPSFFRTGVKNAFHNIAMPIRFVSNVLQGKIKGAGTELTRFVVNTTVGVAGLWDPAEHWLELKPYEEDLGQTLGVYGVGNGFYIVWPFLGPSTLRDSVGMAGDMFLDPLYYVDPNELSYGLSALKLINNTTFRLGDYEAVKAASLDPYVMIRDFYIHHRTQKIAE